jgi:hypothetical protein
VSRHQGHTPLFLQIELLRAHQVADAGDLSSARAKLNQCRTARSAMRLPLTAVPVDGFWPKARLRERATGERATEQLTVEMGDHIPPTYPGYASEAALRRGRILFYLRDYEGAKAAFSSVKTEEVSELANQAKTESLAT